MGKEKVDGANDKEKEGQQEQALQDNSNARPPASSPRRRGRHIRPSSRPRHHRHRTWRDEESQEQRVLGGEATWTDGAG